MLAIDSAELQIFWGWNFSYSYDLQWCTQLFYLESEWKCLSRIFYHCLSQIYNSQVVLNSCFAIIEVEYKGLLHDI